jgi:hypothetical protein
MYAGVSPSTAMSDISSSTHSGIPHPPQMVQQQQTFVTQPTVENSFGPDHIINDLFFPMDLDSKPTEYNMGKFKLYLFIYIIITILTLACLIRYS